MPLENTSLQTHPLGEPNFPAPSRTPAWPVDTPGGRYYAEFDHSTPTTREGQLIFFAQFLKAGERWAHFLKSCPLTYSGNRGSAIVDVIGTIFLSILCGHWRYAHINAVRGDFLNPALLGMNKTVSEDTVRDAFKKMDEPKALNWLSEELHDSLAPVLSQQWILDVDCTVKPIYGHQEGASIGYNPHKPGRPSHTYHSYFMANTRLCLGVEVHDGKQNAGKYGMPGLWAILEKFPRTHWPTFVRGDCGYGNEIILHEAEERGLPYLFKLRQTKLVQKLIIKMLQRTSQWVNAGDGWEVIEAQLQLSGWTRKRRVVLVREVPAVAPVSGNGRRKKDVFFEGLKGSELWSETPAPWSGKIAVLVTRLDEVAFPALCMARLYRERGDAENVYDELKNQWGWGGYTSKRLGACRIAALLVAVVYNWWHMYVRMHDANRHREAITSRPALLGGTARLLKHSGQRTVRVSLQHDKSDVIEAGILKVSRFLHEFEAIAEEWTREQRWGVLLTYVLRRWLGGKWLGELPPSAQALLSG